MRTAAQQGSSSRFVKVFLDIAAVYPGTNRRYPYCIPSEQERKEGRKKKGRRKERKKEKKIKKEKGGKNRETQITFQIFC